MFKQPKLHLYDYEAQFLGDRLIMRSYKVPTFRGGIPGFAEKLFLFPLNFRMLRI